MTRQRAILATLPLFQAAIDACPLGLAVLNFHRQTLIANQALLRILGDGAEEALGRRPGEVLGCIHYREGPDGCGTARHCACCGAVNAVLESQKTGVQVSRECRLTRTTEKGQCEALDLAVTATPIEVDGTSFTICTIDDISAKKRLTVLHRTFFHDVLNTAGCIQGYARFVAGSSCGSGEETSFVKRLADLSDQLLEEIHAHRDLTLAESGNLKVDFAPVSVFTALSDLKIQYAKHAVALDKTIELGKIWHGDLVTDQRLLARILGNMLKNALEATERGGTVTLDCDHDWSEVRFSVHNATVIPDDVRLQIFQRSFSTKAEHGRGIGTHSMKLLSERYLGGKVDFVSQAPEGTTFVLRLPIVPPEPSF